MSRRAIIAIVWTVTIVASLAPGQTRDRPARPPRAEPPQEEPARQADPMRWGSGVAARVNRDIITTAEVWKDLQGAIAGFSAEKRAEAFRTRLAEMIWNKILDQATARLALTFNQGQVDSFLEERKEEMGGAEGFGEWLLERGLTESEYVTDITKQSQRHLYLATQSGARGALGPELRPEYSIDPTVAEIRDYYRQAREKEFTHGAQAKVWAMALTRSQFGGEWDQVLAKCEEVRDALATGADFRTLARRYSRLEEESGGDLGWISPDASWNEAIVEYAFEGPVGAVSEPIKFRTGYFLVLVEERREARVVPFSEAQVTIRQKLRQVREKVARTRIEQKLLDEAFIWPASYKTQLVRAFRSKQ